MEPNELIGMWVPYTGNVVDDNVAVLIDTDVNFEETVQALQEDDSVHTYGFTITHEGPYDLLAFGQGHYRLVKRTEYRKRPAIEI